MQAKRQTTPAPKSQTCGNILYFRDLSPKLGMLQHAARRKTLILLDFLAPSLISRASSTVASSRKQGKPPTLQPDVTATVIEKIKKQINYIHSTHGHNVSESQAQIYNTTLAKLRQSLAANDARAVRKHWQHLEQHKLIHFLGPSQLGMVSGLLTKEFLPKRDEPWDPSVQKVVEDVAILAAANRSWDALNACLLVHIKQNNPNAAITLYERFMELVRTPEKEALGENKEEDEAYQEHTSLASIQKPKSRRQHPPSRVSLLVAVTTAHAMLGSFEAALKTCLATVVQFHHATTKAFLLQAKLDQSLQGRVETYIKRLGIATLVARPPSLSRQITNLSTSSSTKSLQVLYQTIIDGLSGPDAYLAGDPSAITPTMSVAMTEVTWTSFMVAFMKCERRDLASKLWEDMAQLGVMPGVSMWTAIIDVYSDTKAVDKAVAAWGMMVSQGLQPDGLCYRALISALFNGRRPEDAMKTFQTFRKDFLDKCPVHHSLAIHNTVLHGLIYAKRIDEAMLLLRSMETKGPTPDLISYNTFLAFHGRHGDFKALSVLINKMAAMKLVGDVFSYSTILSALLKAGREDAPDLMLSMMEKHGVKPNVATFTSIIDHQMREENEKNLQAALRVLSRMEDDPNLHPNEITYTSILAGLYRGRWLPVERAEEYRTDIVERMEKRGIRFKLPTYHILIKACLEYPHPEGLHNALTYYHQLTKNNLPVVQTTWYILLAGLMHRGEWTTAEEIIKDMYLSGFQPGSALLELVSRVKRRTAVR